MSCYIQYYYVITLITDLKGQPSGGQRHVYSAHGQSNILFTSHTDYCYQDMPTTLSTLAKTMQRLHAILNYKKKKVKHIVGPTHLIYEH